MSPRWLLLYPGLALLLVGVMVQLTILRGPIVIAGVGFDIHTMLYSAGAAIVGLQLVIFAHSCKGNRLPEGRAPDHSAGGPIVANAHARARHRPGRSSASSSDWLLRFYSVNFWLGTHLSALDPTEMMRYAIPSVGLMIAGGEIVFASFVLSFIQPSAVSAPRGGAA